MSAKKEKIEAFLKANKKYRKSDKVLMSRIWYEDLINRIYDMTALEFLLELSRGNLSSWETMTRLRRQIQKEHPELRDPDVYEKRKDLEFEYRMQYGPRDSL